MFWVVAVHGQSKQELGNRPGYCESASRRCRQYMKILTFLKGVNCSELSNIYYNENSFWAIPGIRLEIRNIIVGCWIGSSLTWHFAPYLFEEWIRISGNYYKCIYTAVVTWKSLFCLKTVPGKLVCITFLEGAKFIIFIQL